MAGLLDQVGPGYVARRSGGAFHNCSRRAKSVGGACPKEIGLFPMESSRVGAGLWKVRRWWKKQTYSVSRDSSRGASEA